MEKGELDNAFWRFAINFYEKPNVAEFLLRWQDDYQLDVVMVLLMLYSDEQQLLIDAATLQHLLESIQNWRNRIETMRNLRRELKSVDAALYQQAKQFELQLEQYYMAALYQKQQKFKSCARATLQYQTNLELYVVTLLGKKRGQQLASNFRQQNF